MWYAILGWDGVEVLAARRAARAQHLARVEELRAQGRILLAGPLPAIDAPDPGPAGFAGSLIVAEFDSLDTARAWAEADPYVLANVWQRVVVYPFPRVA
jgi:hypothetical protein